MIECVTGLVGGGKSYTSVRRMLAYMGRGGRCVSNILLTGFVDGDLIADSPVRAYLRKRHSWDYQPGQYIYIPFDTMLESAEWFHSVPAGPDRQRRTLLVIDESTDLFDSWDRERVRVDSVMRELFRFLRLSRHAHIDVVFICQDFNSINSRLRGLVGAHWTVKDMSEYRIASLHIPFPFRGFLLQKWDRTAKIEFVREWLSKDKDVFGCYTSEAFNSDVGVGWDGVEVKNGRVKDQMKTHEKLLLWASLIFGCMGCYMAYSMDREGNSAPVAASPGSAAPVAVPDRPALPAVSREPVTRIVRASMTFHQALSRRWALCDGAVFALDAISEYGRVVRISESPLWVQCLSDNGDQTYILPREAVASSVLHSSREGI